MGDSETVGNVAALGTAGAAVAGSGAMLPGADGSCPEIIVGRAATVAEVRGADGADAGIRPVWSSAMQPLSKTTTHVSIPVVRNSVLARRQVNCPDWRAGCNCAIPYLTIYNRILLHTPLANAGL